MDQTQLQQKIAEYYHRLPKESQEVFFSMQWLETLRQISLKYGLNDAQIETLGIETTLVLLGIIHLDEYENTLKSNLGLQKESTERMLKEINSSILETIRLELAETFEKNDEFVNVDGLDERFAKLTKETQEAIKESNYQTKIYEIGQKYNLTIYQTGILGEAIISAILGAIPPDKLEDSLKGSDFPSEKIKGIVDDANEKIFKKIREELVKNIDRKKTSDNQKLNDEENKSENISDEEKIIESREEMLKKIENPEPIKMIDNTQHSNSSEKKLQMDQKELPAGESEEKNPTSHSPEREEVKKSPDEGKREGAEESSPILAQKLSGVFQVPTKETNHTLTNVTKSSGEEKTKLPKIDPYREVPE